MGNALERACHKYETTQVHTALHDIIEETVEPLSSHEELVNDIAENRTTPLHCAVLVGCEEVVKILLEANSDATGGDYAARRDHFLQLCDLMPTCEAKFEQLYGTIYGFILDTKNYIADVNAKDEHERTPLHIALENRNGSIARLLLNSYGADVNARDIDGSTPLHYAIRQEYEEIFQLLLEYGANINARNVNGTTPLHIAATTRCFRVSNLLLKNGADVNARDKHGKTPMHHVVAQTKICKRMVEILLDAGSDVNILDNQGCTPISAYYNNSHIYKTFGGYRKGKTFGGHRRGISKCRVNNWYRPIIRLFRLHTLKLRAAGLHVNEKNLQHLRKEGFQLDYETRKWIQNLAEELRHYHLRAYKVELDKMKNIKLSAKVSLYDILTDNSRYKLNNTRGWNSRRLNREFPIYKNLLINKFELKRLLLLEDSKRSFSSLSRTFLPDEMLEKIFSHLDNEDLQNLILSVACRQTK